MPENAPVTMVHSIAPEVQAKYGFYREILLICGGNESDQEQIFFAVSGNGA
jgi:hypothetical protein